MDALRTKTIDDVARALGISKTTVSRSISGKGRISEATRRRVLDYIEANNYRPNPNAKGLAQSRTYNIAWVIPTDSVMTSLSFFQRCMRGVIETAAEGDVDVLIATVSPDDISGLRRIVENQKVDGIILAQTLTEDPAIRYLRGSRVPFVVIGSTEEPDAVQIDNDHIHACTELSELLRAKGIRRAALIGGDSRQVVNRTRQRGFELGMEGVETLILTDCVTEAEVQDAVTQALREHTECIVCADERICYYVMLRLKRDGVDVPGRVRVASFYGSEILENSQPPVTSLNYDPRELGEAACRTLLAMVEGESVEQMTMLGYELLIRQSTE